MSPAPLPAEQPDKGRHYEFIKSAVHDSFKTATVSRVRALADALPKAQPWYTSAPAAWLKKLAAANLKAWNSQNQVDHLLANTDLYAFAEPLLKAKIKADHGIEPDVKSTYLRLYLPAETPWYAINVSEGVVTRTVSLLDAALHNFASSETVERGSDYISKPDERGLFDVVPIKGAMPINDFQKLCRELDIGAQYKKHLESYLLPDEPLAESVLQYKVSQSQKDALVVAAQLALIKDDIAYDAYKMILGLSENKPLLMLNGRSLVCADLSLLGTRLVGVLLLAHAQPDNRGIRRLIVYIPHDPDHPLKEYISLKAFREELTRQLREDRFSDATQQTYRQFFSQFVDHQQRGHFFAELEQRLFVTRYHPRDDPTDQRPAWRKDAVDNPHLQFARLKVSGDYWRHAYQQKLNKILNDAREIAVSTADTDSKARWAWWDNFKKILSDIFNVALLIAAPFVPGLGELMMVYTAYQLTTDVIEGIVDMAEGLWQEAGEHVISVVTNVIELAAFGAGAEIAGAFKVKLSPLVDDMKQVQLPDGKASLWHPDLGPYEQKSLQLDGASKPDPHGLHDHGGERILPLDGKLFSVEKASTRPEVKTWRVKHPQRDNAYKPLLEHNEHGAWRHEAENPADWNDNALMPRLGHRAQRFSPTQLEQIRISSGTGHHHLRRMHSDSSPPPPLLADGLKRYAAYDDAQVASANIRAGKPIAAESDWFEPIATSLPGWPYERALKVEYDHLDGYSRQYGNPMASAADTLTVTQSELYAGQLPERLLTFLDEGQMRTLLGRNVPVAERVQALRNKLADAVDKRREDVSKRLYQAADRTGKADLQVVRKTFPELPLPLGEKLLSQASAAEMQRTLNEQRLPLRLKNQARELDFEARSSRAYESFYRDLQLSSDSERLALGTLRLHTDTFADLHIEVRDGTFDGPLRCSSGPDNAKTLRRLIRNEHGRYEVFDANARSLHAAAEFHEAILRALPDETLTSIGYRRGQGAALKVWLMELAAAPAERRTVLAEPPIRPMVSVETETLLGLPRFLRRSTPEERIRDLYPAMTEREASTFLEALTRKGEPKDAIARLEQERKDLQNELTDWRSSYTEVDPETGYPGLSSDYLHKGGDFIEERLKECFERRSEMFGERSARPDQGYTLDLSSDLVSHDLERWWNELIRRPKMKPHLDRITALKLDRARLSPDPSAMLSSLPNLRQLSARQCELQALPDIIGLMRPLQDLDLADNRIKLTSESRQQLGQLEQLRTLNLNGNPLDLPPDVGAMNHLTELSLANTRIESWPEGLFRVGAVDKQRPQSFMLDMRAAPIKSLPEVTPGSVQARILSRARLDTSRLSVEDRVRLGGYRESVGLALVQDYFSAADDEIRHWRSFPQQPDTLGPTASFSKYRKESWHDLMAEPDSAGFFSVIRKLRESADYQTDNGRRRLTQRVWEMVDAVALDAKLRETLFQQIVTPEDCGDFGAQLFNSLGLKVLVSKAYGESTSPAVLEDKLVRLARAAARLNRVTDEAALEYRTQVQLNKNDSRNLPPDEVEVHMAFETGLAERLQLPWQSEGMLYRPRSGVTQKKVDIAFETITKAEQGDGLVNGMLDLYYENFWEEHLLKAYPDQYERNAREFEPQEGWLDELREAQAQWASTTDLASLTPLNRKIERLAGQLGIADTAQFFENKPMSDARYEELLIGIGYQRNELSRRLTREALKRAGL
ncbi:dermonecrotic toxin domain-containing protein [Pseudomonas granadensis]|uniref:dermonecrotic toxin domain-containing protein n=1 Tax=Pseudomonas granadensis TaxID=1421430 RepID=UPI00300E9529